MPSRHGSDWVTRAADARAVCRLERSSHLALLASPEWVRPESGKLTLRFALPRQAVSLLVLDGAHRLK